MITDEDRLKASHLGFINQLQFAGNLVPSTTKQANADGTPVFERVPFSQAEIQDRFTKYATEWRPHRDRSVELYATALGVQV